MTFEHRGDFRYDGYQHAQLCDALRYAKLERQRKLKHHRRIVERVKSWVREKASCGADSLDPDPM